MCNIKDILIVFIFKKCRTPDSSIISHGGYSPGGISHGGYSPGGISHGSYSPGGISHGGYSPGGISHGGYSPGGQLDVENGAGLRTSPSSTSLSGCPSHEIELEVHPSSAHHRSPSPQAIDV